MDHSFPPLREHGEHTRHPWEGSWAVVVDLGVHSPLSGHRGHMFGARRELKHPFTPLRAYKAHLRRLQSIWALVSPFTAL